jgi:hypothetical protein
MFRFISSLSMAFLALGSAVSDGHLQISYPLVLSDSSSASPSPSASLSLSPSRGGRASIYDAYTYMTPMLRRLSLNETFDSNSSNWIVVYDGGYKFNPDWYAAIFVPSGVFLLVILCLLYRQGCCYRRPVRNAADGTNDVVESASASASAPSVEGKEAWTQQATATDASGVKRPGVMTRTYVNTRRLVTCA